MVTVDGTAALNTINQIGTALRGLPPVTTPRIVIPPTAAPAVTALTASFRGLYAALGGAVLMRVGDSLLDATIAAEQLELRLKSTGLTSAQVADQIGHLRSMSSELGLNFQGTATANVQWTQALVGTSLEGRKAGDIFDKLAKSMSLMGLPTATQTRAFLALEQMASKGVVTMEELRRQLGNAVPGALHIAAQAMGVTTQQLIKMVSQGQVASEDFLPKFADQLDKTFGHGSQDAIHSTTAELNRLSNAWLELKQNVTSSDFWQTIIKGTTAAITTMTPGTEADKRATRSVQDQTREAFGKDGSGVGDLAFEAEVQLAKFAKWIGVIDQIPLSLQSVTQGFQNVAAAQNKVFDQNEKLKGIGNSIGLPLSDPAELEKMDKLLNDFQGRSLQGVKREEEAQNELFVKQMANLDKLQIKAGDNWLKEKARADLVMENVHAIDLIRQKEGERQEKTQLDLVQMAQDAGRAQKDLSIANLTGTEKQSAEIDRQHDQLALNIVVWNEMGAITATVAENMRKQNDSAAALEKSLLRNKLAFSGGSFGDLAAANEKDRVAALTESDQAAYSKMMQNIQDRSAEMAKQLERDQVEITQSFRYGASQAMIAWGSLDTRVAQVGASIVNETIGSISSGLVDIIDGTKTASQGFIDMGRAIEKAVLNAIIQELFLKQVTRGLASIGGGLSGIFGHQGGVIGGDMMQRVPRRFHGGGVVGDEVQIVARRSEAVFTPDQLAALGGAIKGGGKQSVTIINPPTDAAFGQWLAAHPEAIINPLLQNIRMVKKAIQAA